MQNLKSIDENLEEIEHIPEEELKTIDHKKKAELIKTKNIIQEFIKLNLKNLNDPNQVFTKTCTLSNVNEDRPSFKMLRPIDCNGTIRYKVVKKNFYKPKSSKDLQKEVSNNNNDTKSNIQNPFSKRNPSSNNLEFPIEENFETTKKRSSNQLKIITPSEKYNNPDTKILDEEKSNNSSGEEGEEEYVYEQEQEQEPIQKNPKVKSENSSISSTNDCFDVSRKELQSEIEKWKQKGDEYKHKIINVIGEDNFKHILNFYFEKTNVSYKN